jgi:hypothetical protein
MNWILAQMDAGIAAQVPDTGYGESDYAAFKDGTMISWLSADWYAGFFKDNAPELAGKWKAAPLPAWEEGGIRTSVLGGTGATIVATSPNVEAAWEFLEFAMLSVEGNVRRFELTNLFPPFIGDGERTPARCRRVFLRARPGRSVRRGRPGRAHPVSESLPCAVKRPVHSSISGYY